LKEVKVSEKIITVKEAKRVDREGNSWIELIDHEDKTHRVFASMQADDGRWVHFEDRFEELENSAGLTYKLIKEKKGQFWNVIDIIPVKEELLKQATKQAQDESIIEKRRSMALSYAKDIAVAKMQAGAEMTTFKVLTVAKVFESYIESGVITEKKTEEPSQ
jgi:hypothetical protein